MEVNRTAFYAWRDSEPTVYEEQDAELAPLIRSSLRNIVDVTVLEGLQAS